MSRLYILVERQCPWWKSNQEGQISLIFRGCWNQVSTLVTLLLDQKAYEKEMQRLSLFPFEKAPCLHLWSFYLLQNCIYISVCCIQDTQICDYRKKSLYFNIRPRPQDLNKLFINSINQEMSETFQCSKILCNLHSCSSFTSCYSFLLVEKKYLSYNTKTNRWMLTKLPKCSNKIKSLRLL